MTPRTYEPRYRKLAVALTIILLSSVILLTAPIALAQSKLWSVDSKEFDDMVYLAEERTPLSSVEMMAVSGIISSDHSETLRGADVELDLSRTDEGYIFIRYLGERQGFQIALEKTSPDAAKALYQLPATGEWAGLPLSLGSGCYHIQARPFDITERVSRVSEQANFEFAATYDDELAPYRYANVYSDYDYTGRAANLAAKLKTLGIEELGRTMTDAETVEAVIGFVHRSIKSENGIPKLRKGADEDYYFPDIARTLEERKGCCADKCALAAAMLKSLGTPVQIHYGFIEKKHADGEYELVYHAWLNVWQDGAWIMYDPTFSKNKINGNTFLGATYLLDTVTVQ